MSDERAKIIIIVAFFGLVFLSLGLAYFITNRDTASEDSSADVGTTAPFVEPDEVIISNVTQNSATISWVTPDPATGYIEYGNSAAQKNNVIKDFRDTTGASVERTIHYIQVTGLSPDTEYFFDIYSNGKLYENSPETTFSTFPQSDQIGTPETVLLSAGSDFDDGGVFYGHVKNDEMLSTTISVFSTSSNVAMTVANAKDPATGDPVDLENAYVLVSGTNPEGRRTRDIVAVDNEDSIVLASATFSQSAYEPLEDFTTPTRPVDDVIADDPVDDEPEPSQPSVGGVATPPQVPKTAIEPDQLRSILSFGGAVFLVILGVSLSLHRKDEV